MSQLNLSSEDKLQMYCARTSLNEDITYRVKEILNGSLNWNYVVKSSISHGIAGLLYWNLSKIDNGRYVPEQIMAKLKDQYYRNITRNMLFYNELSRVLRAFKDAGIDVIVLKGAFLAEIVYKNIGLRSFGDLDLLIKKEDLLQGKKKLAQLRYRVRQIYPTEWHEQWRIEMDGEIIYTNQDTNLEIDLHYDIQNPSSPFQVDISKLWENTQAVKIAGIETLTFSPEDLVVHLCLHFDKHLALNKHLLMKIDRMHCDIAEVLSYYKGSINWDYLVQVSKKYGIEEPIYQSLYLVNKNLNASVQMDFFKELEPIKSNVNFNNVFGNSKAIASLLKNKNLHWRVAKIKKLKYVAGIRIKTRLVIGYFFPSKKWMIEHYRISNKKLIYVYYLIRFGYVFNFGINAFWQLLLGSFKRKTINA